jgi:hypothetical protein
MPAMQKRRSWKNQKHRFYWGKVVRPTGIEPVTHCLEDIWNLYY